MLYMVPSIIRISSRNFFLNICLQQFLADIKKNKTQQGMKLIEQLDQKTLI